jgi:hypothetical protein
VKEGIDISREFPSNDSFFVAMARAQFRHVGEDAISVNVYVPDEIFRTEGKQGKRLAEFTYVQKWNLFSTARNFTELALKSLTTTLECLRVVPDASFNYSARRKPGKAPNPRNALQ